MPKLKILIIDYEPRGIKELSEPLERAGYAVEVAKNGLTGIEAFGTLAPDLALIEAMLPKKHGFDVCRELKGTEHGAKTPIVVVSSVYKGRKYRRQALHQNKADEFLEKPVDPAELIRHVERLLREFGRMVDGTAAATQPAAAKPAANPPTRAAAAPATQPAKPATQPAAKVAPGSVEAEIIGRLDEILGGGPSEIKDPNEPEGL